MSLKEKIRSNLLEARKANNTPAKNILTVLLGDIQTQESTGSVLTDEQIEAKIRKLIESNKETIAIKPSIALSDENSVLESFLPKYLTQEEVERFIRSNSDLFELVKNSEKEGPAIGLVNKSLKENAAKYLGGTVKDAVLAIRSIS